MMGLARPRLNIATIEISAILMLRTLLLAFGLIACWGTADSADIQQSLKFIESSSDYRELVPSGTLQIDLRYATTNNFMGRDLYGAFKKAYLHKIAADKLKVAERLLQQSHPGYRLVLFDALRPRSVQYLLWEQVKGTDQQRYVANPASGSIHNYGFAVDISLADGNGRLLDMGTEFDAFTPLAEPRKEDDFLRSGQLSAEQIANRKLLRSVMEQAGFIQLPVEWWHFDALPKKTVKNTYRIVE